MRVYIDHDISRMDLAEALAMLPAWRREQALAYRHELHQRLSAAAYLLLWHGLRRDFGISEPPSFAYADGGKPSIVGHPELHFNLSHCPKAALCAIGHSPVGADIETIRPYNHTLAKRVLSDDELLSVASAQHPAQEFARLWTMKESLLKLTGEGIRRELRTVLQDYTAHFATTMCPEQGYAYTIATWPSGD